MVNFKEFVDVLGAMCKADYTKKIKLLYLLHQPPCLLDNEDMDGDDGVMSPQSGGGKILTSFIMCFRGLDKVE